MSLRLHCALFMGGLLALFFLGKMAGRRRRLAVPLAAAAGLWLIGCIWIVRRQDVIVRLADSVLPIGDQILLLPVWFAWPASFLLAALGPWLSMERDRRAVTVFNGLIIAGASLPAAWLATWPYLELGATPPSGACLQTADYSCGAASAVNFLRLAGLDGTEEEMARACGVIPLRGITMAGAWWGVEKKLRTRGRAAELVRPSFDRLLEHSPPMMISIRYRMLMDHMVVLLGIERGFARVLDPARGEVIWKLSSLREAWLGDAVVLANATPPDAGR